MSSNATLALAMREEPQAVMLTTAQLNVIANTEFVPKSMRGNVPKVLACVARGRAMGIADAVALGGIDIIDGKATLSAELMCAIVRKHGHSITGDVSAERAVVRGKRRDNGDEMTAEFNREMAEAAGLLKKSNWVKHPDDMMWARAVSKLCRRLFADCFAGGTYAPEDMQPTADETMDGDWQVVEHDEFGAGRGSDTKGAADPEEQPDNRTPFERFAEWVQEHEVPKKLGDEIMGATFPGRKASDLTADELGVIREKIELRMAEAAS